MRRNIEDMIKAVVRAYNRGLLTTEEMMEGLSHIESIKNTTWAQYLETGFAEYGFKGYPKTNKQY